MVLGLDWLVVGKKVAGLHSEKEQDVFDSLTLAQLPPTSMLVLYRAEIDRWNKPFSATSMELKLSEKATN